MESRTGIRKVWAYVNPVTSFRARLVLAFAITTLITCGVLLAIALVSNHTAQEASVQNVLVLESGKAVDIFDRSMFERLREIVIATSLSVFTSPTSTASEQRAYLDTMQTTYTTYAWIGYTAINGTVLASTDGILQGANVSARPWFQAAALGAPFVGDVHNALLLQGILQNLTGTKDPFRFVDVANAVRDPTTNRTIGILGAHLYWNWAQEIQSDVLSSYYSDGDGTVTTLSNAGIEFFVLTSTFVPILQPPGYNYNESAALNLPSVASAIAAGEPFAYETWDGIEYVIGISISKGYRSYQGLGWVVLLRQKRDVAFKAVDRNTHLLIGIGIGLALVFSIIGWIIAHQIVKPITRVVKSARMILKGTKNDGNQMLSTRIQNYNTEQGKRSQSDVSILCDSLKNLIDALENEHKLAVENSNLEFGIKEKEFDLHTTRGNLEKSISDRKVVEDILLNVMPESIIQRLKNGEKFIAETIDNVTIFFSDIVGFTTISSSISPLEVVSFLNDMFSRMDDLAEQYDIEKIKTIGDAYFAVGGLFSQEYNHSHSPEMVATNMLHFALDVMNTIEDLNNSGKYPYKLALRVGIHTGPVVAGIIGEKKFAFDLWGDSVNVASRMESSGEAGRVHVSKATYKLTKDVFGFAKRGSIQVKGKGEMNTYWLTSKTKPIYTFRENEPQPRLEIQDGIQVENTVRVETAENHGNAAGKAEVHKPEENLEER